MIRIPRIVLRFPNTFDRYISREFFRYFALVLSALAVVYVLGLLVDVIPSAIENRIKGKLVVNYVGNEMPQILFHMLPLATLMPRSLTLPFFPRPASSSPLWRAESACTASRSPSP